MPPGMGDIRNERCSYVDKIVQSGELCQNEYMSVWCSNGKIQLWNSTIFQRAKEEVCEF